MRPPEQSRTPPAARAAPAALGKPGVARRAAGRGEAVPYEEEYLEDEFKQLMMLEGERKRLESILSEMSIHLVLPVSASVGMSV